jgi:antitoxin PrlF
MALARIRGKGQVTLPDDIRRAANITEGDIVEVSYVRGAILLRPKRLVDADQAWFWSEEWQRGEREASADIANGRTRRFASADEFLDALDD